MGKTEPEQTIKSLRGGGGGAGEKVEPDRCGIDQQDQSAPPAAHEMGSNNTATLATGGQECKMACMSARKKVA